MIYSEWIIAIYDEYVRVCSEKYTVNIKPKELIKIAFSKENYNYTIMILSYIIFCIVYGVNLIIGCIETTWYMSLIHLAITWVLFFIVSSSKVFNESKVRLVDYEGRIDILVDILSSHGLNNLEVIEKLEKDTRGIFYSIRNGLQIGSIVATIIQVMALITSNNLLQNICIVLACIGVVCYMIYKIFLIIPNNKVIKTRKFNELLKILLMYRSIITV